jgi:hypothetical protein
MPGSSRCLFPSGFPTKTLYLLKDYTQRMLMPARNECCVSECDLETSRMRRPWPALGCRVGGNKAPMLAVKLMYLYIKRALEAFFPCGKTAGAWSRLHTSI